MRFGGIFKGGLKWDWKIIWHGFEKVFKGGPKGVQRGLKSVWKMEYEKEIAMGLKGAWK